VEDTITILLIHCYRSQFAKYVTWQVETLKCLLWSFILSWAMRGNSIACPICRSEEFMTVPNKQIDRLVRSYLVYCTNKKRKVVNACEVNYTSDLEKWLWFWGCSVLQWMWRDYVRLMEDGYSYLPYWLRISAYWERAQGIVSQISSILS